MIKLPENWMRIYKSMDNSLFIQLQILAFDIANFDVSRTFKKEGGHRYISKNTFDMVGMDWVPCKKTIEFLENEQEMKIRLFSKFDNKVLPRKVLVLTKKDGKVVNGAYHDFEQNPEKVFKFKITENGIIKNFKPVEIDKKQKSK